MTTLFTILSETEGRFGQGTVPGELHALLDEIAALFLDGLPPHRRAAATHHEWCQASPPRLRTAVRSVKRHPLWRGLGEGSAEVVRGLDGMDELYLSRLPRNREMLFGAAANFDLHVDGVFHFPFVRVYRVLVGLAGDDHVETQFPGLGVAVRIGRGDFVVFDFDRARHRVERMPAARGDHPRLLLKLHFFVAPAGLPAGVYAWLVTRAYIAYEAVTRRVMAAGTEPRTVPAFALGMLGQFAVRHPRLFVVSAALPLGAGVCALAGASVAGGALTAAATGVIGAWVVATGLVWLRSLAPGERDTQASEEGRNTRKLSSRPPGVMEATESTGGSRHTRCETSGRK